MKVSNCDLKPIPAPMGEMSALIGCLRTDEIGGVDFTPTAHDDIDPLPCGVSADDREGAAGGDTLGFVTGEGIAVVDVALVEIPVEKLSGLWVTVELDGQAPLLGIDADHLCQIAVEHS